MNVSATIPATVQIRRGRLLGLLAGVAVAAAAITWAILTFGVDGGNSQSLADAQPQTRYSLPIPAMVVTRAADDPGYSLPIPGIAVVGRTSEPTLTGTQRCYVKGVSSLTPVERTAAFGGVGSVLDAPGLGPAGRRYVEWITAPTQRERAAAFGQ